MGTETTRRWLDSWHGPYFFTVAIGGFVISFGWQWGDYRCWSDSPIRIARRRGR